MDGLTGKQALHLDTIVYIVQAIPGQRDVERFGVKFMRDQGLRVEVWDVHEIFLPGAPEVERSLEPGVSFRRFSESTSLVQACSALKSNCLVVLVAGAYRGEFVRFRKMLRSLSKSGALLGAVSAGHRPPVPQGPKSGARFFGVMRRVFRQVQLLHTGRRTLKDLRSLVGQSSLYSIYRLTSKIQWRWIRPLDWAWVGTNIESIEPLLIGPRTRIRLIHTWDYDRVLRQNDVPERTRGPIYLDAMGPLHPDFKALGIAVRVNTDRWFAGVNSALMRIDRALGQEISVAAHPRATPGSLDTHYPNRSVHYGQTLELVRDASLVVISNPTTALGYAVIFEKPVLVLQGESIFESHANELLQYAGLLGLEVLALDDVPEDWQPTTVDRKKYSKFRHQYIKSEGSPEAPFWSLLLRDARTL